MWGFSSPSWLFRKCDQKSFLRSVIKRRLMKVEELYNVKTLRGLNNAAKISECQLTLSWHGIDRKQGSVIGSWLNQLNINYMRKKQGEWKGNAFIYCFVLLLFVLYFFCFYWSKEKEFSFNLCWSFWSRRVGRGSNHFTVSVECWILLEIDGLERNTEKMKMPNVYKSSERDAVRGEMGSVTNVQLC